MLGIKKRNLPGNLYGFGIGKASGWSGKNHWGVYLNFGRWHIRIENQPRRPYIEADTPGRA